MDNCQSVRVAVMNNNEPVAWMSEDGDLIMGFDKPHNQHGTDYSTPLYTHPRQSLEVYRNQVIEECITVCWQRRLSEDSVTSIAARLKELKDDTV